MPSGKYQRKLKGIDNFENEYLKVIGFSHQENRNSYYKILNKQDNSIHVKSAKQIRQSNYNFRFCLNMERKNNSAFNGLYHLYKHKAKERNLSFNFNKEEFKTITSKKCHYCDDDPEQKYKQVNGIGGVYLYNGIDRKDNNIGYELSNCVPCCGRCNHAKFTTSYDDFINWINKVHTNMKNKE